MSVQDAHALSGLRSDAETNRLLRVVADFAAAERAAKIGYWRWVLTEKRPFWSPGMYDLLVRDAEIQEPDNDWLVSQIHPDDQHIVVNAIAEGIKTGLPIHYRCRDQGQTGVVRTFDNFGEVEKGPDGRTTAVLTLVQEVTASVQAETALQRSEEEFRHLTEYASDMISRHTWDSAYSYCSPSVLRLLGFRAEELIGMKMLELVHDDDRERTGAELRKAFDIGQSPRVTYRMRRKDDSFIWYESSARAIPSPHGGPPEEVVVVSRDVTERYNAELDLQAARERAEAASRTKSRFLANMSHELRTPLNAIIGFSDILLQELFGPIGTPRYKEYAQLINESGQLLLDLISDILDMSKIEAGKYELHVEELDAGEIVRACVRLMEGRANEHGVTLETIAPQAVSLVRADKRAVKQILLNLLSNAIKFTPNGGAVRVRAEIKGGQFEITVTDTGVGIPPEDLPRIGRPFEQVSADANLAKAGTGLGLALVKSLAQLHGGSLRIDSVVGQGTTVLVTLPIAARFAPSLQSA